MRRTLHVFAITLITLLLRVSPSLAVGPSGPEPILRKGFTFELGLGVAMTHDADGTASRTRLGIAPLSASLGGFVSPRVALLGRAAGTSYFGTNDAGRTAQYVYGYYGVHLQYWLSERWMVSGGPGLLLSWESPFLVEPVGGSLKSQRTGFGASLRSGYAVFTNPHHTLRFSLEAFPGTYGKGFVFGSAVNFEWQFN